MEFYDVELRACILSPSLCLSLWVEAILIVFICLLVSQAIFTGEKIEDITPVAPNAVLILGEGNLWISLFKIICKEEVL